jgi:tetratricopeptide (TPR) repeat protein
MLRVNTGKAAWGRGLGSAGRFWLLVLALVWATTAWAATERQPEVVVLGYQGTVEKRVPGSSIWIKVGQEETLLTGDMLRTGARSRATLQRQDRSTYQIEELTTLHWDRTDELPVVRLLKGILKFFHRDRPDTRIEGGGMSAAVLGTEFVFQVADDDTTKLTLYDGAVQFDNALGGLTLSSGDVAVARPGEGPVVLARLMTNDFSAIQWAVYYPAILDPADLGWRSSAPDPALEPSLTAYRTGNLPHALAAYPPGRHPASPEEELFLAALVLSVGRVDEAEECLARVPPEDRLARLVEAHRLLIGSVLRRADTAMAAAEKGPKEDRTATEWLALSYARQAQALLGPALEAAHAAAARAPDLGFALVRQAELEFSFGRIVPASRLLDRALARMPEHAAAHVLRGFLHAAANRMAPARDAFERALTLDPSLGDAWLGRGLAKIRGGDLNGGRADLIVAAAAESQRSVLRSYLAKAYADSRVWVTPADQDKARHEFELAKALDPRDPTPWLYGSLAAREENRLNDAVRGLAEAEDRAGERAVYRSALLLDQDRAVAAANQAAAFRDAGMFDVGVQTAGRALARDPANPSAHQFLAESYVSGDRATLRYETPRVSEYLVANLLSPVGGGLLSASLSQQEYSRLFERDGIGMFSQTSYLSRGAWSQTGGALGTFGRSAFLAEAHYSTDPGRMQNSDVEQLAMDVMLQQQVGPRDTLYFQTLFSDMEAGDLRQVYDPTRTDTDLRVSERLMPAILAGWHRAWSPEHHTLVLAGWIESEQELSDPTSPSLVALPGPGNALALVRSVSRSQRYAADSDLFTTEAQHLWQTGDHTLVAGARWQAGRFVVDDQLGSFGFNPALEQNENAGFRRSQAYLYDTWQVIERLGLTAALSYDDFRFPVNHRYAPVTDDEDRRTKWSPKAGLVWEPWDRVWFRGVYTKSLGGVGYDTSFRLEPTQVAGFNQAFRSLIPESVEGPSSVPEFETLGFAVETRLGTNTWLSLSGERLSSEVSRHVGIQLFGSGPKQLPQDLGYEERAMQWNVNHLLGRHLALGVRYRLSDVELDSEYPGYSTASGVLASTEKQALLHTVGLSTIFNHESGAFAGTEALWYRQENSGNSSHTDEDLWQLHLWGGYRFARRRAEVRIGILNLTDADYRLNPVSPVTMPERERTFFTRFSWRF